MHRILVDTQTLLSPSPSLECDALRHLKVVRAKNGEEVELFDGRGLTRVCTVSPGGVAPAGGAVSHKPPSSAITLFGCVTKQNRWEWTIEKAVELGATRIVPVLSERCVVKLSPAEFAAKRERWLRVAEEAARQSHAVFLPEIAEPCSFARALELAKSAGQVYAGVLTDPPPPPIAQVLSGSVDAGEDAAVFTGPEGDFSPGELAGLLEIATPVSFGPTVLRAETAAIFGVAMLAAFRDAKRPC